MAKSELFCALAKSAQLRRVVFPILQVPLDAVIGDEQLGSKEKFWFAREDGQWLFKKARQNTGEDWAEKLGSELARLLEISAAQVELSCFAAQRGSASKSFVRSGENLTHGNEILAGMIVGYDRNKRLHQTDHTLANIRAAVKKLVVSQEGSEEIFRDLCGYFVLDGLICNTDRHHENWGLLSFFTQLDPTLTVTDIRVAPSFDHASSLGRELLDEKRKELLARNQIGPYARRGRGGIYLQSTDAHGANPLQLVEYGAEHFRDAFHPALLKLADTPTADILSLVDKIPHERASATAREFSRELLTHNRNVLVGLAL
jgi:hypothetical protein